MIPRWLKSSYYALASPLMRLNAVRHRIVKRPNFDLILKAQLGPGQKKYLPGWINVDANLFTSKPDVWADLRFPLPFKDNYLKCIYSHHVIEHLPDLEFHFADMYRCLNEGGIIRVGGPHGGNAIQAMNDGLHDWYGDWPKKRKSIGGKFENFIFCNGEHLTILTESFLRELATSAGFRDVTVCLPGETMHPSMIQDDVLSSEPNTYPSLPKTIMIEAVK